MPNSQYGVGFYCIGRNTQPYQVTSIELYLSALREVLGGREVFFAQYCFGYKLHTTFTARRNWMILIWL